MFEQRNKGKSTTNQEAATKAVNSGAKMSAEAKGNLLAQAADEDAGGDLLGDLNLEATTLNKEADYAQFGQMIAEKLYKGKTTYNAVSFFREVAKPLPQHLDSKTIKKITDNLTKIYNDNCDANRNKHGVIQLSCFTNSLACFCKPIYNFIQLN